MGGCIKSCVMATNCQHRYQFLQKALLTNGDWHTCSHSQCQFWRVLKETVFFLVVELALFGKDLIVRTHQMSGEEK